MTPDLIVVEPAELLLGGYDPGTITDGYLRFWLPILGPTSTIAYRMPLDATEGTTSQLSTSRTSARTSVSPASPPWPCEASNACCASGSPPDHLRV